MGEGKESRNSSKLFIPLTFIPSAKERNLLFAKLALIKTWISKDPDVYIEFLGGSQGRKAQIHVNQNFCDIFPIGYNLM